MTHSYVCHDSFICVTRLIQKCDTTCALGCAVTHTLSHTHTHSLTHRCVNWVCSRDVLATYAHTHTHSRIHTHTHTHAHTHSRIDTRTCRWGCYVFFRDFLNTHTQAHIHTHTHTHTYTHTHIQNTLQLKKEKDALETIMTHWQQKKKRTCSARNLW